MGDTNPQQKGWIQMRALNRLTAKLVQNCEAGKYPDGGGLWLHKREDGGGQWVLRVTVHGRRREMGLGGIGDVSLAEARELATDARRLAKAGTDPIKKRQKDRRDAERNLHRLAEVAADCFESRKAQLKGDGKAGRWFSPLEIHVLPKLGQLPVSEIDQLDIRDTLKPIWHTKAATAQKAMDRINIVIRHAAALGLDVDLQAVPKAKALLGKTRHRPQNIPSMDWREVPEFYASLDEGSGTHLALRLLILTGLRSTPIRFAHLDQFDSDVWTVPEANMKAQKDKGFDFRVPLSSEALDIIEQASAFQKNGFLFPNTRRGVISDATMSRLMERRGLEARPHGFRSSMRTWISDNTDAPFEVAEASIAHLKVSKVVDAYRRTDFLEQRKVLAERWADHVTGGTGQVVRIAADG